MTMRVAESPSRESSRIDKSPQLKTITIPVLGMSCAACQSYVERSLRQTRGVDGAEVNLITHTARVAFDPELASPQSLVEAVKNSGYESSLPADTNPMGADEDHSGAHHHHPDSDPAQIRIRALVALALAAAAMLLSMPLMHSMSAHPGFLSRMPMKLAPGLYSLPAQTIESALLVLTLIGMWIARAEVYRPAWRATLHRTPNRNTLVALGTIAALLYSAVGTLTPEIFVRHGLRSRGVFRVGPFRPRLPFAWAVA